MAIVSKNILGYPSGRCGDVVYRYSRGKVYVYPYKQRPKRQGTPEERKKWSNFGFITKTAGVLNKLIILRQIWEAAHVGGTAVFNKIVKYNLAQGGCLERFADIRIIPHHIPSFMLEVQNIFFSGSELAVAVRIAGGMDNLSVTYTPELRALGFMILQEPNVETLPVYKLIPLSSMVTSYTGGEFMLFNIPIVGSDLNLLGNYAKRDFVLLIMTGEIYTNKRYYSNNITGAM